MPWGSEMSGLIRAAPGKGEEYSRMGRALDSLSLWGEACWGAAHVSGALAALKMKAWGWSDCPVGREFALQEAGAGSISDIP